MCMFISIVHPKIPLFSEDFHELAKGSPAYLLTSELGLFTHTFSHMISHTHFPGGYHILVAKQFA